MKSTTYKYLACALVDKLLYYFEVHVFVSGKNRLLNCSVANHKNFEHCIRHDKIVHSYMMYKT